MKQLLILNIAPELEEGLVDYLLDRGQGGFTSFPVRGHGEHGNLSIAEQVSGRRKRIQFELMLDEERVQPLLTDMGIEVGKDIMWWIQPVLQTGRIS